MARISNEELNRMWQAFLDKKAIPKSQPDRKETLRASLVDMPTDPEELAELCWREENPPAMSETPISTRLPWWMDDELRKLFRRTGEGPARGLRRIVCEWYARERWPELEFRGGETGRRAGIVGGPDVWRVIVAWRAADLDWLSDPVAEREFGRRQGLSDQALTAVTGYANLFPEDIDQAIAAASRDGFASQPPSGQR